MTDRQTVSTADYEQLKKENEELKRLSNEVFEKLPEFEVATEKLIKTAYWSVAHRALYSVSFIYMVIDLYKTHF